jgi:hypothetical protein
MPVIGPMQFDPLQQMPGKPVPCGVHVKPDAH